MATGRVLVIAGDRAIIEQLREAIDRAGFDMEIALTPGTGLSILEQRQMDSVILDLELQELRSASVVRDLRRAAGPTPLVGIAAAELAWDERESVRAEIHHWIEKGTDTKTLSQELESVFPMLGSAP